MRRLTTVLLSAVLLAGCASRDRGTRPITMLAAASLAMPLDTLCAQFTATTGLPVRVSYGASGTLARQIEMGADADIFFPADTAWLTPIGSHMAAWWPVLRNRLVLVTGPNLDVQLRDMNPLSPGITRIAIADPASTPSGRYAVQLMQRLGWYETVKPKLVPQEDVRGVVRVVAMGAADLGFVYQSDLAQHADLRLVEMFDESVAPPVVCGVAKLRTAHSRSRELCDFLQSEASLAVFRRFGFETGLNPSPGEPP